MLKILDHVYFWLAIVFLASLIFDIRFIVSVSTILLMGNAVLYHRVESGRWWNKSFLNWFTLGCFLYFFFQMLSLLFAKDIHNGILQWQTNLGLIALPVAVFYSSAVNRKSWGGMMKWYIIILLFATIYALAHACTLYLHDHNPSVFFYHPLVHIYLGNAIQFSILVFVGILFLVDEYSSRVNLKNPLWTILLLIYFSGFLFLLTSKLIIAIYFVYIIYILTLEEKILSKRPYRFTAAAVIALIIAVILTSNNPLKKRIVQEQHGSIAFIRQDKFDPGDYFTGVQFRLISWRFVYEILNEKHQWLMGVNIGDAQDILDKKYKDENMFTGGSPGNKTGYIGYHTHNQFLQALLETGILGLLAFMIICAGLVRLALKLKNASLIVLITLLLCNCFTDALLKTQYGIILFVFFPLFMYKGTEQEIPAD
jgi:O-antigen ligase